MKICIINSLYQPDNRGGAEVVVENIISGLISRGDQPVVVTTGGFNGWRSLFPERDETNGTVLYRFFPLNLFWFGKINQKNIWLRLWWHLFDVFNFHSYFIVKKILYQENPGLVLTHNLKGLGYLIPRAIKKLKIKNIHTVHDLQLYTPSGIIIKGKEASWEHQCLFTKIYRTINRRLFSYPELIVSPSKWLINFYQENNFFVQQKTTVINNPIEVKMMSWPISEPKIVDSITHYLYLGQLDEHKGVLFLINTFLEFVKNNPDKKAILHLVGTGKLFEQIKNDYGNNQNLVIHGFIPHEHLGDIFSRINYLIIPSLWYENAPMVIAESFLYGVPVIGARIGGISEMILEGVNGYLFVAGDGDDLMRVLTISLNSGKIWRRSNDIQNIRKYLQQLFL